MSVPSILQKIVAHKREEVASRKTRGIPDPASAPPPLDFAAALRRDTVALIAEVKRASPSRGSFSLEVAPQELAVTYAEHGAACISVLTDEEFFRGSDEDLRRVRAAVSVPLLRKEFIIDPWQIAESRALGADCILLIAAILEAEQLRDFQARAQALGMAALIEVHTPEELEKALAAAPVLLGINNRNLHTFETTLETTEELARLVTSPSARSPSVVRHDSAVLGVDGTVVPDYGPQARAWIIPNPLLISESGIFTVADVARVARAGARAILVGEALVRGNTAELVAALSGVPIAPA